MVFPPLFANVTDPRDPQKILYPLASLAFAGVTMFLFHLKVRRQIGLLLRNGPSVIKFQGLFGVESFPHGDTLETTFSNLKTDQIQTVSLVPFFLALPFSTTSYTDTPPTTTP